MGAIARIPVLPEANPVGALSAQDDRSIGMAGDGWVIWSDEREARS
jgi:hypothetical protein